MADRDRVRALAEERFGPPLREDQVQLLAAVQAGRVRRFRRNAVTPLSAGEDYEFLSVCRFSRDSRDSLGYRLCGFRLRPLIRRELVTLDVPPEADQPAPVTSDVNRDSWPWRLTQDGEKALARTRPHRRATTTNAGVNSVE